MEDEKMSEGITQDGRGKSKIAVGIIIAALILVAGYFLINGRQASAPATQKSEVSPVLADEKVFKLTSKSFEFSQKEIRVKKGERVRIELTVEQGFHDWVVDEFSARTKQIKTGESDSVVFVADKAGNFEFYCSVGSHRQMGMVGKLIVE